MTNELAEEFAVHEDFPAVGYDEWRALADDALKGADFERKLVSHTYDGIDIQPIYSRRDQLGDGDVHGFPGIAPFVRGSRLLGASATGWDLRQEYAHPELAVTNRAILEDLENGVTSLLLRFDRAAAAGLDPDAPSAADLAGRGGVMIYSIDDLDTVLANVRLDAVGVALDAGAAYLPAAAGLVGLWQRRGVEPSQASGAFNADPFAVLSRHGELPVSAVAALASLAGLAKWTAREYPRVTAVGVDTSPYHDAGATAAQDIAVGLATGVEYLRALTNSEVEITAACRQIQFRICIGTHHFLAIAKLRAARRLWARVVAACGGDQQAAAMRIHARTGNRVLTQHAPHVNLLRNTVAVFAAGVGGADAITSVPFDAMIGHPDAFSRRVARNTALVLQEESHLHRVVDPAGGSWYLDQLTDQLAQKAWHLFQQIEIQGGMLTAIERGWVAGEIVAAFAPRARDIASRRQGIVGISEFPNVSEQTVKRKTPDLAALQEAASARIATRANDPEVLTHLTAADDQLTAAFDAVRCGVSFGRIAAALGFSSESAVSIPPLQAHNFAARFEELRDASDNWQASRGQRPLVFLANMGPVAEHTARASYAKNFFEAGGFEVLGNDGFEDPDAAAAALAASGAKISVICSSDRLYEDIVQDVAPKLKAAGSRTVVLAGNPGGKSTQWKSAGVDRFIYIKCDVLQTLRELLREEGVLKADAE